MKKYYGFLLLVISLLVACGGDGDSSTTPASPTTAAETPTQGGTQGADGSGTLEIRVTDQPADAINSILVTIANAEVHVSGGQELSGWTTVVEEPQQFEILELMVIEELLDDTELEPGRYQQLRFEANAELLWQVNLTDEFINLQEQYLHD